MGPSGGKGVEEAGERFKVGLFYVFLPRVKVGRANVDVAMGRVYSSSHVHVVVPV